MDWNVGGVYLVACALQAVILVFASYTLIFLKLVKATVFRHFSFSQKKKHCNEILLIHFLLQEERMEKPGAKCCYHLIFTMQPLLIFFSRIYSAFIMIRILFSWPQ